MLEQSTYRLLGCLDYSLSAFFQVGLNEKAVYSEFRITAVMPESPSCTEHCLIWDSSSSTGKASRCFQGSVGGRSWLSTTGSHPVFPHLLCGCPSPLQMGPTAFSAFIPEDVVGMGTVSRRYPRFSFLCQRFV